MDKRNLSINQRVVLQRRIKGLNQTQMGQLLGIKTSTYSQKERKGKITAEEIVKIADILDVDVDILLYGENRPTVPPIITVVNPKTEEIEEKIRREYVSRYGFLEKLTLKDISYLKIIFSLRPKQRNKVFGLAHKFYIENKKSPNKV